MFSDLFKNQKKIPFSTFVNYALYSSNGYYSRGSRISKSGDFITSPIISKIYSQAIASSLIDEFFSSSDNKILIEGKINLVELGSNDGTLMMHIVDYFSKRPEIYNKLNIIMVEKSLKLHRKILKNLYSHRDKLLVTDCLSKIPAMSEKAIIFCNEFFDALSFERCLVKNKKLYQINLKLENNRLIESIDLAPLKLAQKFQTYNLRCKEDAFFEFPIIEYELYFELLAKKFKKIFFLINDYGDRSDFFQNSQDPFGTSRCFYQHKVTRNFYENIFYQDITYDVNFNLLSLVAEKFGFKEVGFSSQTKWMLNNRLVNSPAIKKFIENQPARDGFSKLIHPNSMGERFKFISFKL